MLQASWTWWKRIWETTKIKDASMEKNESNKEKRQMTEVFCPVDSTKFYETVENGLATECWIREHQQNMRQKISRNSTKQKFPTRQGLRKHCWLFSFKAIWTPSSFGRTFGGQAVCHLGCVRKVLFGFGFGKDGHALVWRKKLLWHRCLNMFRLLSGRPNNKQIRHEERHFCSMSWVSWTTWANTAACRTNTHAWKSVTQQPW